MVKTAACFNPEIKFDRDAVQKIWALAASNVDVASFPKLANVKNR